MGQGKRTFKIEPPSKGANSLWGEEYLSEKTFLLRKISFSEGPFG